MRNNWFAFKQFTVVHTNCAMKVGTDACLLGAWAAAQNPIHILDIGAGSGVVGLMLAQRYPQARIDMVEIEEKCAATCLSNAQKSPFSARISCVHSAIQDFESHNTYDLVVSNPPYFQNNTPAPHEARNLARHQNKLPLFDLFVETQKSLAINGNFCLILPFNRLQEAVAHAQQVNLFLNDAWHIKSLPHKSATRVLLRFSRQKVEKEPQTLVLCHTANHYTIEARALLSPFYLNL